MTENDRARVERILRQMTRYMCTEHPSMPGQEVIDHVEGAMQVLRDTHILDQGERMEVIVDEFWQVHKADN